MRQIFVDSRDRISGTSTNFSIQLPETLTIEGSGHRMRIDNLRIPNVFPTIVTGVNDTLSYTIGSTQYTITLLGGNYDGPRLANVLQTMLTSPPSTGTWTVVYDIYNTSLSISCNLDFSIANTGLGVQLLAHLGTQTANSYLFAYVSTQGLDICYLTSGRFSTIDTVGPKGSHDTLMCGVISVPYGSVCDFSMPWDTWITIPAVTLQQIDFQLRDRSYNVLSIVPNISFVVCLD